MLHKTKAEANEEYDQLWLVDPNRHITIVPVTRWDFRQRKPGELIGYQVAEVHRVGWWGKSPTFAPRKVMTEQEVEKAIDWSPVATVTPQSVPRDELVTVKLPFSQETNAYIGGEHGGKVVWFGKTTLVEASIRDGFAYLTLARKAVMKRQFQELIVG